MKKDIKKQAIIFILFLGIISFFSDFTHEGARSIYGQYLNVIGASAFIVAFTAGLGEFIGQALRLLTGIIADKTKKYWTMMILGYAVNLLAIPLLALVKPSIWYVAVILILLERVGKAIRSPAKSALTSFTAPHLGAGKAFAINEVLDQLGAFLGPLMVFFIVSANSEMDALSRYQMSFAILGIFAVVTLILLFIAKSKYPNPETFEKHDDKVKDGLRKNKSFIIYMVAISFIAMGFVDYPVIAYHMDLNQTIAVIYIPLLYSVAMGIDAISALIFGILFDKIGIRSLIISTMIAALTTPFIFLLDTRLALITGIILWGIGMGAQESILKAVVAKMVPKEKRATGYGIFSSVFGLSWFLGSMIIGLLYQYSLLGVVIFAVTAEVVSVILLILLINYQNKIKKLNTV
jgi:MFS family permease